MMEDFSENLVSLRRKSGKTQKEVADELGIVASAMSAYENGQRLPSLDFAVRIAQYYGTSLDALCGIETKAIKEEGKKTCTRPELLHLLTRICESVEGSTLKTRTEHKPGNNVYIASLELRMYGDDWLNRFCEKLNSLLTLYRSKDIDIDVIEAWKEKQCQNTKDLPADTRIETKGTKV